LLETILETPALAERLLHLLRPGVVTAEHSRVAKIHSQVKDRAVAVDRTAKRSR